MDIWKAFSRSNVVSRRWRDTDGERTHILQASSLEDSGQWRPSEATIDRDCDQRRRNESTSNWRRKLTNLMGTQSPATVDQPTTNNYAYYNTQFVASDDAALAGSDRLQQEFGSSLDSKLSAVMQNKKTDDERERKKFLSLSETNVKVSNCRSDSSVPVQTADFVTSIQEKYGLLPPENISEKVKRKLRSNCVCNLSCFIAFIKSVLPVISWLPKYKAKYILPDMIAGFTISILHIPQGMAYGILASLKAENGLYVSFFPVLIYFLFGTSKHISIGTFAVISIMTASAVEGITANSALAHGHPNPNVTGSSNGTSNEEINFHPSNLEIATSLAVATGLWQLLLGVFKLGALSVVLSDHLVSGFTTGAAIHVATSQVSDLLGIKVKRYKGPLKLIYMYEDIFGQMRLTNGATVIISAVSIFVLAFTKEQINDRFKNKLKMPIPIDLVVVIIATVFSYTIDFSGKYDVKIMGSIPTGLPDAVPPRLDFLPNLAADGFAIAIVVFVISLSMAKLFAKKHQYSIRPNQELIAVGCANIFSSFFACYPCSASLSRSLLQERAGGRTQMASVVSCAIILLVLLILAPLFKTLPRCILAAVILVALKGMFLQVGDFIKAWRISKTDALIWLVTVLATVILDISYGLMAGVVFSILTVIVRTVLPSRTFLGNISGTDIYLDMNRYSEAKEIKGVKIFHFGAALYSMNKDFFKSFLQSKVPLDALNADEETCIKSCANPIHHIIIDCSSFSYIDMSGLETLLEVIKEYHNAGVTVFLAGCSVTMYDTMMRAKFFDDLPQQPSVFVTVHDAVQMAGVS